MALRTFHDLQQLRSAGFRTPGMLLEEVVEKEARGEAWTVHFSQGRGREVWTLVLPEEQRAVQWLDGERVSGAWVAERQAVKLDERDYWGLFNLEGRQVPLDAWDDDEHVGDQDL